MTNMKDTPITVSGSSGFIGSTLVRYLKQQGYYVQTLVRREPQNSNEVHWNPSLSILDSERLENNLAIIHLGGENLANQRWSESKKQRILESRIQSTQFIATRTAALSSKPKLLISASGTGFYGEQGTEICRENATPGNDFLAQVCRQWEDAATPARQSGVRVVHLRLGLVLDQCGGALQKMLPIFRLGLGGRLGNGRQFLSWIDLDDLHRMIEWLFDQPSVAGPINCTSPLPITNQEFTRVLGRVLGRPTFFAVPRWALQIALGEMSSALLTSIRATPQTLLDAGFQFNYPSLEESLLKQFCSEHKQ